MSVKVRVRVRVKVRVRVRPGGIQLWSCPSPGLAASAGKSNPASGSVCNGQTWMRSSSPGLQGLRLGAGLGLGLGLLDSNAQRSQHHSPGTFW